MIKTLMFIIVLILSVSFIYQVFDITTTVVEHAAAVQEQRLNEVLR